MSRACCSKFSLAHTENAMGLARGDIYFDIILYTGSARKYL